MAKVRGKERAQQALRLRAEGLTFRQIASELGFTAPAAHKAVKRALEEKASEISEAAGELRAIAQSGDPVTQDDLKAGNERAQAAINGYKNLNNCDRRTPRFPKPKVVGSRPIVRFPENPLA